MGPETSVGNSRELTPGDPCPWLRQRTEALPNFVVDAMAGRYLVLCFYKSTADPLGRGAIEAMLRHRDRFNDRRTSFFGVSIDPRDEAEGRVRDSMPGVRYLWDFDGEVSRQCGAMPRDAGAVEEGAASYRQFWMIVDPTLHVLAVFPFSASAPAGHDSVFAFLDRLPDPASYAGFDIPAPVLILPNVFEPELCRDLIARYDAHGGKETGVMREGVGVRDKAFKRRRDFHIRDQELIIGIRQRIMRRVAPEIRKLFFMRITRLERYIVGCYAVEDGGHFQPHRDNNQPITAHRRFAVSINLNDAFDGGEVSFPEYNLKGHKVPPGWAVVFPCAILHAVSKVTRGRRYAFLPFVYDEAGAKIRAANLPQKTRPETAPVPT